MKDHSRDFSLYIHVPFCASKCAYCDFLSFVDCSSMERYFSALFNEIRVKGAGCDRAVDNIYIGGGTPSVAMRFLPQLGRVLRTSFGIKEDAEISIECNPESVTEEFVIAARSLGVNRVSMGVQSLSDPLLKRIGRVHDRVRALDALSLLTRSFPSVGADVMVGLPDQTEKDLSETLDTLLSYPIDHLSCYSLILEKGTPLYREAKRGVFRQDDDLAVDLYDLATARLKRAGFERYEISNFCKNEAVCRYNTSVWQYGDYLGLGLGASSFVKDKQFPARRYKNTSDLCRYLTFNGVPLTKKKKIVREEGMREFIMLGLRLSEGLSISRFNEIFGEDFYSLFGKACDRVSNCLDRVDDHLFIKSEYLYVSNSVISEIIF